MRIGAMGEPHLSGTNYRAGLPTIAMSRRGHEAVLYDTRTALLSFKDAATCDVVMVFRGHDPKMQQFLKGLVERGVGLVWDIDDDVRNIPKARGHKGGLQNQQIFRNTLRVARLADAVTVTSEPLRELYAAQGIDRIQVIENYLWHEGKRPTQRHSGLVVGWIAGLEHASDIRTLELASTMRRLQEQHADLHVECIGVDLGLTERYRHRAHVLFDDLLGAMAGWDIAIAPIAQTPFNEARSNIKVKEYAASSVPWLASDRGPYVGLGEAQGGRLVADDGWYDALDALLRDRRARKRLAKAGRSWAKGQTIEAAADRYEAVFLAAAERAARRRKVVRPAALA